MSQVLWKIFGKDELDEMPQKKESGVSEFQVSYSSMVAERSCCVRQWHRSTLVNQMKQFLITSSGLRCISYGVAICVTTMLRTKSSPYSWSIKHQPWLNQVQSVPLSFRQRYEPARQQSLVQKRRNTMPGQSGGLGITCKALFHGTHRYA